ncbi:hypothetical protein LP422_22310 [Janibacter limosus]|nr:hypothetical protein LP422_22310 [Janibacter limosus]
MAGGGVEQLAADIVEVHVDPVGRGLAHLPQQVALATVDDLVEAELAQPGDLVRASGDADDPAALGLGQLGDGAADGAGSGRDEHGVPRLGPTHVLEAEPRGHARHARGTEPGAHRGDVEVEALHPLPAGDGVLTHAEGPAHDVTDGEVVVLRGDDGPGTEGTHDGADLDRREVGAHVVEPATHGRVEGDLLHLDEELPRSGVGHLRRRELPVLASGAALRAGGEADLLRGPGHGVLLCSGRR